MVANLTIVDNNKYILYKCIILSIAVINLSYPAQSSTTYILRTKEHNKITKLNLLL